MERFFGVASDDAPYVSNGPFPSVSFDPGAPPPEPLPIGRERQLFLDGFLIDASRSNHTSIKFHAAEFADEAVQEPSRVHPWTDGVFELESQGLFAMVLACSHDTRGLVLEATSFHDLRPVGAGSGSAAEDTTPSPLWLGGETCLSVSRDGYHWSPVHPTPTQANSPFPRERLSVIEDRFDRADRRFKAFAWEPRFNLEAWRAKARGGMGGGSSDGDASNHRVQDDERPASNARPERNVRLLYSADLLTWHSGPLLGTALDSTGVAFVEPLASPRGPAAAPLFAVLLKDNWLGWHRYIRYKAIPHASIVAALDRCEALRREHPGDDSCQDQPFEQRWGDYAECTWLTDHADQSRGLPRAAHWRRCADFDGDFGVPWMRADEHDAPYDPSHDFEVLHLGQPRPVAPRLTDIYLADFKRYESVFVGFVGVHTAGNAYPKVVQPHLIFSRDGLHFARVEARQRAPFLRPHPEFIEYQCGAHWIVTDRGPPPGGVRDWGRRGTGTDEVLRFFCGAIRNVPGRQRKSRRDYYADEGATLSYDLRRDGFASVECRRAKRGAAGSLSDAPQRPCLLVTKSLVFTGAREGNRKSGGGPALFLNVRSKAPGLVVMVKRGEELLASRYFDEAVNSTRLHVFEHAVADEQPFRLEVLLPPGTSLFSFWLE